MNKQWKDRPLLDKIVSVSGIVVSVAIIAPPLLRIYYTILFLYVNTYLRRICTQKIFV